MVDAVRKRIPAYFLLAPGTLWLVIFFVIPLYFMAKLSLDVEIPGTLHYEITRHRGNYNETLKLYDTQFLRSFYYAAVATILCLVIAYPLAYVIAFKAGKWQNLMLVAGVAPVFTTYLSRRVARAAI